MIYENKDTKVKLEAKDKIMADILVSHGWVKYVPKPKAKAVKKGKG